MSGHVHAENMRLYAEDAATTDKPWLLWQCRHSEQGDWRDFDDGRNPSWLPSLEYRRKPRTIMIEGVAVPEPLRTAPPHGTTVYIVDICIRRMVLPQVWVGGSDQKMFLERGFVHLTREAAEQHANALIKFSAK